jgi:hypothetical protein
MSPTGRKGVAAMKRITITLLGLTVFALLAAPSPALGQHYPLPKDPEKQVSKTKFIKAKNPIPHRYIVVLEDDVAPADLSLEERRALVTAIANEHARKYEGKVGYIYETALRGYSIELPDEAAAIAISKLPRVRWVEEDSIGSFDGLKPASGKP